ncbi:MAG: protoglobin domain-containing protein, partial [Anaerolineales bacterium]
MDETLEIHDLSPDPVEEWQRVLNFIDLTETDRQWMAHSVEALMRRSTELVINTYEYLRSVPETAAILGWENEIDQTHLEERRRFFTIWLARTLGIDTSDEFAYYLFRAGKYHAGHGPRKIHTPPTYVTASIGMVLSAFSRYMIEAGLPADTIALSMSGWSKYLSLQLNQMLMGYQISQEYNHGDFDVRVSVFGRLRPLIGSRELSIPVPQDARVSGLLKKFFDYYPQARAIALNRIWNTEENDGSLWLDVVPAYIPRRGW